MKQLLRLFVLTSLTGLGCSDGLGPSTEVGSLVFSLSLEPATVERGGKYALSTIIENRSDRDTTVNFGMSCWHYLGLYKGDERIEGVDGMDYACLAVGSQTIVPAGGRSTGTRSLTANISPGEYKIRADWTSSAIRSSVAKLRVR